MLKLLFIFLLYCLFALVLSGVLLGVSALAGPSQGQPAPADGR